MIDTISIPVGEQVIQAYGSAAPDEKRRLLSLLESVLNGWANRKITIQDVMNQIGAEATNKGMTPEVLADILKE